MLSNLFRLGRRGQSPGRPPLPVPKAPRPQRRRLGVEELEPREVPAVSIFITGGVLTAQCDSGFNVVTVDHDLSGGGRAIINGAAFSDSQYNSIRINGGVGGTLSYLRANVRPLSVVGRGPDTVNVGNPGNGVQGIQAPLSVTNPPDFTTLNVDDSADPGGRTATISAGAITGLAPAVLNYEQNDLNALNVWGGTGANTFNVTNTPSNYFLAVTTTLRPGGGYPDGVTVNVTRTTGPLNIIGTQQAYYDIVNLGEAGSLQNIRGAVSVSGRDPTTGTSLNLRVHDEADGTGRTATISDSAIVGLAPAAISYQGDAVDLLYVWGGTGANTFTVTNTPRMPYLNERTNLYLNSGNDRAVVQRTTGPLNVIGAGGNNTLVGSDSANTWAVTGRNAGTLTGPAYATAVAFASVQNLTGGPANDTFRLSDGQGVDGSIDGGGGTNTLDYSAYRTSVLVDLNPLVQLATGVVGYVSNIQNVLGSGGGAAGNYNLLVGSGGNVLIGGNGRRNLLIAGASASTLVGGDDDDILIGGTTAYDTDLRSLLAVMVQWARTDVGYDVRVANLLNGAGAPLLDGTTVFGNGGGNTLTGYGGGRSERNLFFGNLDLDGYDWYPGLETFISV
jgi:hypothetical protein